MTDLPKANAAITDGRLQQIFEHVSKTISPESTFFYSENGHRAALMVFEMKDSSLIPLIAEPFFHELNAKVEFFPAMDVSELSKGLEAWNKQTPVYTSLS
jgi:hypothetical protein